MIAEVGLMVLKKTAGMDELQRIEMGREIERKRVDLGWTQVEAGAKAVSSKYPKGLSQRVVGSVEDGSTPNHDHYYNLARAVGFTSVGAFYLLCEKLIGERLEFATSMESEN